MKKRSGLISYELMIISREPSEVALELIRGVLVKSGIGLQNIVETDEKPFHHLSVYFDSSVQARSLEKKLRQLKIKRITLRIKRLVKKDWFNKWKTDFKAFQLTRNIRVIPAWDKRSARAKQAGKNLILDTGFAFGTGMHPTTRFMASMIEQSKDQCGRFLDVGTGTGILALVAMLNGCTSVKAIDISADAVHAANTNFIRNGFKRAKAQRKDIDKLKAAGGFDFVAANLITQDLIHLKTKLCRLVKKGGVLAVSGISTNNLPTLKKEFRQLPLQCIKTIKGDDWAAVKYRKN